MYWLEGDFKFMLSRDSNYFTIVTPYLSLRIKLFTCFTSSLQPLDTFPINLTKASVDGIQV